MSMVREWDEISDEEKGRGKPIIERSGKEKKKKG